MERSIGTILNIGINAVARLKSINGLSLSADTIDITHLDSPDRYREFMQGLKDGGEVTAAGSFEPSDTTGQKALHDAFETGALTQFAIIFPNTLGAQWSFRGIVTGISTSAENEDVISFETTIKVSGKPTLEISASNSLTALALTGTGGTLSPAFAGGTYYYAFSGVTAASVTVTATLAGAEIKLYVDGAFVQDLTSGSVSAGISMSVGSKKLTLVVKETGKASKVYEIVVVKIS